MNRELLPILSVLMMLLASLDATTPFTIEELNTHLSNFFTTTEAYTRLGGGSVETHTSLVEVKSEFESKFKSGVLQKNDLDPYFIRMAEQYVKIEELVYHNVFNAVLDGGQSTRWADYLKDIEERWKKAYREMHGEHNVPPPFHGYAVATINAYLNYWNTISPMIRRFLSKPIPDMTLLNSIRGVSKPDEVQKPQRRRPFHNDATYTDLMIQNIKTLPSKFLQEVQAHISDGNTWALNGNTWALRLKNQFIQQDRRAERVAELLAGQNTQ